MENGFLSVLQNHEKRERIAKGLVYFSSFLIRAAILFSCSHSNHAFSGNAENLFWFLLIFLSVDFICCLITGGCSVNGVLAFAELFLLQSSIYLSNDLLGY